MRERREDIPLLATAFAEDICQRNGMALKRFTDEAMHALQAMEWRGERPRAEKHGGAAVIMTPETVIEAAHIGPGPAGRAARQSDDLLSAGGTFQEFKDRAEAAFIRKQLEATAGTSAGPPRCSISSGATCTTR